MKIRTGFVSNSSSSSFVIIGKEYTENDFKELVRPFFSEEEWNTFVSTRGWEDYYELFTEAVPEKFGIDIVYDQEGGTVYAGISPFVTEKTKKAITEKLSKFDKDISSKHVMLHNDVLYS